MANLRRNAKGQVIRNHQVWSLENFADGYVSQGRFKVYLPQHPRASPQGYVLRAIASYEACNNRRIPIDINDPWEVHHRDGNKLNDGPGNLVLIRKSRHLELHRQLRAQPS